MFLLDIPDFMVFVDNRIPSMVKDFVDVDEYLAFFLPSSGTASANKSIFNNCYDTCMQLVESQGFCEFFSSFYSCIDTGEVWMTFVAGFDTMENVLIAKLSLE